MTTPTALDDTPDSGQEDLASLVARLSPPLPSALPDPEQQPTVPLWPTAGQALGIGRSTAYNGARNGDIPTIRVGDRYLVPTAALRKMLGL